MVSINSTDSPAPDHLTLEGEVSAKYDDKAFNNISTDGDLRLAVEVYLESREKEVVGHENTLYLTGRGVCCRATEEERSDRDEEEAAEEVTDIVEAGDNYRDSVTYETELDQQVEGAVGETARLDVDAANALVEEISRKTRESINSPDRYPAGQVGLGDTRFVTASVGEYLDGGHPDDVGIGDLDGDDEVLTRAAESSPEFRRRAVLDASVHELARRFDLDVAGACRLKRAALGPTATGGRGRE
jgi:hypothetical protein